MSIRPVLLVSIFILFSLLSYSGNEHLPVGARSAGLAHTSVTLNDQWSLFHNQAGLGRITDPAAGVYYENRFLINSLSTGAMAAALPVKNGAFGLSFYSFGFSNYRESSYGLAYGRKLGERISAGVQINYQSTVFPESYGKFNAITAELGFQALITDKLIAGAHIYNLNRAKLTDKSYLEYIPTIARVGLQYMISEKVIFVTEFQKDIEHPIVFRAGTEYMPNEKLILRIGIATNPGNYSFGFGYRLKNISLDVAASYHQILGFTPQVGFNWCRQNNNEPFKYAW